MMVSYTVSSGNCDSAIGAGACDVAPNVVTRVRIKDVSHADSMTASVTGRESLNAL